MATTKPPTVVDTNTIALTEKKMDMTLDDIISMSKKNTSKGKQSHRPPIKNRVSQIGGGPPPKGFKARQFADSRSAVRQGVFAQRRTNFNGKTNFPVTSNIAKKAASLPIRTRPTRWNQPRVAPAPIQKVVVSAGPVQFDNGKKPQTMDALFARMQKQRRTNPQLTSGPSNTNRQVVQRPRPGPRLPPQQQQQRQQQYQQRQQQYQQHQRRPYHPTPVYK